MNAEILEDRCTGAYTCPFQGSWGKSGIGEIANCLGRKSPSTHFGRKPVPLTGKLVGADEDLFAEFLSSIMGNEKLFRTYVNDNGVTEQNAFFTDSYIDDSTEAVHLLLVFLAHDMGALSIVKVSIEFGASVSADYTIDHLASVEGGNLRSFQIFGIVHLVALIPFILSSLAAVFYGDYRRAAFNLAVVAYLVAYQIMQFTRVGATAERLEELAANFRNVKWASTASAETKFARLSTALGALYESLEEAQSGISMIFAAFAFLSVMIILSTKAHPRIALLVNTLTHAADDLFHYVLLVLIVASTFCLLGLVSLRSDTEAFQDLPSTTVTLWNALMGNLPDEWAEQGTTFVLLILGWTIVACFLLFNFLIAMIVDAFAKSKTIADECNVEQNLFTDLKDLAVRAVYSTIYRWPTPAQQLEYFGREDVVTHSVALQTLLEIDKDWSAQSRIQFCKFYERFEGMKYSAKRELQTELQMLFERTRKDVAFMLHSDLPTASEREAYFGHKRRLERALLAGNRLMQPRHSALNSSNGKAECTDAEVSMRIVGSEQGSSSLWWREKAPERIMCIEADAEGNDGHAVELLHAPALRERPAGRHSNNPASSDDATINAPPQPVPNGLTSQLGHPDNSASSVEAVLYAPSPRADNPFWVCTKRSSSFKYAAAASEVTAPNRSVGPRDASRLKAAHRATADEL
jgi:hypothetical protein